MGHGAGSVFGEENLRSPAVHGSFSTYTVSSGEFLQGIIHDRDKGLILIDQAVRFSVLFQGFQEIFLLVSAF